MINANGSHNFLDIVFTGSVWLFLVCAGPIQLWQGILVGLWAQCDVQCKCRQQQPDLCIVYLNDIASKRCGFHTRQWMEPNGGCSCQQCRCIGSHSQIRFAGCKDNRGRAFQQGHSCEGGCADCTECTPVRTELIWRHDGHAHRNLWVQLLFHQLQTSLQR